MKNPGLTTSSAYPYIAAKGQCPSGLTPASRLAKYWALGSKQPHNMVEALQNGLIAVYVTVDDTWFQYTGGIFTSSACSGTVNHAVVVVGAGYDEEQQAPYW